MNLHSSARPRTLRDAIYGDVVLNPLQGAIVDTRVFQRLRYVRQNGLLHFVFPGAVHSRFAHSIGAMHLASKAFRTLFPKYVVKLSGRAEEPEAYIGTCFEISALLHDVGHGAFSHSIESVRAQWAGSSDIETFVPPPERLPTLWNDAALGEWWNELLAKHREKYPDGKNAPEKHEGIGLLLLYKIFEDERVKTAALSSLGVQSADVRDDVLAILTGYTKVSRMFQDFAAILLKDIEGSGTSTKHQAGERLARNLHDLVSGTLDVDRLDYLVRDSRSAGVSYGICDVDILLGSLALRRVNGTEVLCLHERAADALDDMLWSRFQLYVQVLEHKTNVALNAMLKLAIPELVREQAIKRPERFNELLSFTDDYVMSNAIRKALELPEASGSVWARALVDRRLPRHLGWIDISGDENIDKARGAERESLLKERVFNAFKEQISKLSAPEHAVYWSESKVDVVKMGGPLPTILRRDKVTGALEFIKPEDRLTLLRIQAKAVPARTRRVHVFVDTEVEVSGG